MKAGLVYVLLIHLMLAIVLFQPGYARSAIARLGFTNSWIVYFQEKMHRYHQAIDSHVAQGTVLFIGDSITQGLATSAITSPSVNYGIGSDTTQGIIDRLPLYESISRSKAVVLAIGTNDIYRKIDKLEILQNYKNILDSITSDVPIIAVSILPIGSGISNRHYNNDNISALNDEIKKLSLAYDNVAYVDAHAAFTDEAGFLNPAFHVGDGLHLGKEGQSLLIDQLKDAISKLDKS